jgi:hypothetical protein
MVHTPTGEKYFLFTDDIQTGTYKAKGFDDVATPFSGRSGAREVPILKANDEIIASVKQKIAGEDGFRLDYTPQELDEIIQAGRRYGLDDKMIEDFIFVGSRSDVVKSGVPVPKRSTADDLIQEMDNYQVIKARGYPYLFEAVENFSAFKTDFKKLLQQFGIPIKDVRIQGSSLRRATAGDIDIAIFVSKADFDVLAAQMKKGISSRAKNVHAANNINKALAKQMEDGRVGSYFFDRVAGAKTFNQEVVGLYKHLEPDKTIDVSIMVEGKNFDVSPYLKLY